MWDAEPCGTQAMWDPGHVGPGSYGCQGHVGPGAMTSSKYSFGRPGHNVEIWIWSSGALERLHFWQGNLEREHRFQGPSQNLEVRAWRLTGPGA